MAPPKTEPEENDSVSERSAKLSKLFDLSGPLRSQGSQDQSSAEDDLFELIVALLKWSKVLDDSVTCLRLVEHLAEHVGYKSAGNLDQTNVTELMLIAARAAELTKIVSR